MSELRFTKIRLPDKGVDLEWDTIDGGTTRGGYIETDEAPGAEFEAALANIKPEFNKLFGWPKAWGADIEIRKVGISYKNGRRAFTITATKEIADFKSAWPINTLELLEPKEEGESGPGWASTRLVRLIDELVAHATLFEQGHRTQTELFGKREGGMPAPDPERQKTLEHEAEIEERRMRAALLEIAPSVTTDRVISDDELTEAIARRWDGIEYIDNDAQNVRDRRWPHVHKHYYDDDDDKGVVWCAAWSKDLGNGTPEDTLLRFWFGIMPDIFDPQSVQPKLVKQDILPLYRELLGLPSLALVEESEPEPEEQPAGVGA